MVRAGRVSPHESERRARAMPWHGRFGCSAAPERSDDRAARSAAPPVRDHGSVLAQSSSMSSKQRTCEEYQSSIFWLSVASA